jgi:predicted nucleotidyltransferase
VKGLAWSEEVVMIRAVEEIQNRIAPVLREHGVRRAGIFGSTARGEARPDSDLDLLVEFEEGRSLLDLVDLRLVLEDLLGREADVVTYASLHPQLRKRVLEEQVEIL